MDRDRKFGQMELDMMVGGMRIRFKAMENSYMQTRMSMKVNFMQTEPMVLEDMFKSVVKRMKVSGQMTNLMEKVN